MMTKIIMYYGAECPHCHAMMPLVKRLEKEEKVKVEKREVWHNDKNADEMRKYRKLIMKSSDGIFGTPAFIDEKGTKALCGEIPYAELKRWAKGK